MDAINGYFQWLTDKCEPPTDNYNKLFWQLFNTEFIYSIPLDGNRAEDGISLRYRYGKECNVDERIVASEIDICPCSVLEMIVALAIRVEENIMYDAEIGDRTHCWIWVMITNLGLEDCTDEKMMDDEDPYVRRCLDIFMQRKYDKDGFNGGLFVINDQTKDLRKTEIWYQAMWFFKEMIFININKEE
jgi:hypothetical protein